MSDSNKYINAYVDNAVGLLHEYIIIILQLKTQLKVVEDDIIQKNQQLTAFQQEIELLKNQLDSNRVDQSNLNERINENQNLRNQLEHMNTFAGQVRDMKQMLLDKDKELSEKLAEKDKEIEKLKEKLEPKSSKPVIVKSDINKKASEKPVVMKDEKEEQANDF